MANAVQFEEIKKKFTNEFGIIARRFEIHDLPLSKAEKSRNPSVTQPGVYVFWAPDVGIIRVGRSYSNSRKRALEHIRDNTGGRMAQLEGNKTVRLFLFNAPIEANRHWIAALEIFFESILNPQIPPGRK